ncbi:MAG: hypothetical protein MJ016_04650 [Victivallaceae bacterium]|nr:hypothetical protein [Victivallaceae bacterium]
MKEKNYDFRARHWQYHKPGMRQSGRNVRAGEIELTGKWSLGCPADAPQILLDAVKDFQDYLLTSMGLSLPITRTDGDDVLFLTLDPALEKGFAFDASEHHLAVTLAEARMAYRAVVYLEDTMNLEGAPVFPFGKTLRRPIYRYREVHSGCGIDEYPDCELAAAIHAGYDGIVLMLKGPDLSTQGPVNVNDLVARAAKFGIQVKIYNYLQTFVHPDEENAQEKFDRAYGDLFRRYPGVASVMLLGESLEFPSRDPHTTGKKYNESIVDGIPDTKVSPGWYPCCDYPAYLDRIEKAVHKFNPSVDIVFSIYNFGHSPLDKRLDFLEKISKKIGVEVCFESSSKRTMENLHTPVMDYSSVVTRPSEEFDLLCAKGAEAGLKLSANVNTAGIGWDFGTVPVVPVPYRWLKRDLFLREAREKWGVDAQYATHHMGFWASVAADLGKWTSWENFEPDYDELLRKIAVRDYGEAAADNVLAAWKYWSDAMDFYTASNEDQYGPWRVGPAYPFIFRPNITRTMMNKEIQFPSAPHAHFGWKIIKTFYEPFENSDQSPGFLRLPVELRSLGKMLDLWEKGCAEADRAATTPEGERFAALGRFIRNSIKTTMNIKKWYLLNMKLQTSSSAEEALKILGELEIIARNEIENAHDTIGAVETDSRLGWEPSMEYVCDAWHLEWKIRQVESALREIAQYRDILSL